MYFGANITIPIEVNFKNEVCTKKIVLFERFLDIHKLKIVKMPGREA